jgi:hypothetical protein
MLRVAFEPERLTGPLAAFCEAGEFAAAHLRHGTVAWPCGAAIDNEVASIRADEVDVWRPSQSLPTSHTALGRSGGGGLLCSACSRSPPAVEATVLDSLRSLGLVPAGATTGLLLGCC